MKKTIVEIHWGSDPKEPVVESTTEAVDQEKENSNLHDKRYEEPFENEGAYADDDIDE